MIRHFLLIVFAVLLCVSTFAQNGKYNDNYDVLLKSGTERFEVNLHNFIENPIITPAETVNGYFYRFLQFKTIPDQSTLEKIEQAGVILFDYVPHKTYIAGIPTTLDFNKMKKWGVRSVEKMTSLQKISKAVLGPIYPVWAERETNEIQLILSYFRNIPATTAQTLLTNAGINIIEMQPNTQTVIVQISKAEIDNVAKLDFLYYVEPIPEPGKPEYTPSKALVRSNVINTKMPSGKKYDGTGVQILVRDDGAIGPHIDFQNRIFQTINNQADGTHGDNVGGVMGGAGNLDPTIVGMAPGSDVYAIDYTANLASDNTLMLHLTNNVMVTNSSYSNGCNGGYTTTTRAADLQGFQNPSLLHVFSAGNSNGDDCGYGAGTQWGNITGGHKIGKNVIAVASNDISGVISDFSSRGPSEDGRLKPDISAVGSNYPMTTINNAYLTASGTSYSAPAVAGVATQLYQAYKTFNNNQNPDAALIKAVLLNGAEDAGNPGPDFIFGWGIANAYRSLETLENGDYVQGSISNNGTNTHTINVPNNVKEVKVMTYWADLPAAVNSSFVLVNDLDMTMMTPTGEVFLPWVLDNTPNPANLNADAVRGADHINNMEQVTLDNPMSGDYTVTIQAPIVTNGTANYYVVTTYIYDEINVVYPLGGEGLVPGTTERIHWDAYDDQGSFLIQFTTDGGANWYSIANVNGSERMYDWVIPNMVTGQAQIRIIRGNNTGQSQADFSILGRPENISLTKVCPTSIRIEWDSLAGAAEYDVFILGFQYMDSIGTTSNTFYDIPVANVIGTHWVAVRGAGPNSLRGLRTMAEELNISQLQNCILSNDIALTSIVSPGDYIATCATTNFDVIVEIHNNSSTSKSNFPVSYDFNGNIVTETFTGSIPSLSSATYTFTQNLGTLSIGNYNIATWTSLSNEDFTGNDTASVSFEITSGMTTSIPSIENFDGFATCGTANNCEGTICPLGNGWLNLTNGSQDDIDWRVDNNGTASSGTGPGSDHTTGNGNYIYLEASQNGGGCVFKEAILVSPCFDLTSTVVPQLSFWYHMNGANMGALHVDIFDGSQWIEDAFTVSGSQGNNWVQGVVDLHPYVGNIINIRFRGITGDDWSSDIALDDIDISEMTVAPSAAFTTNNSGTCVGAAFDLIDESTNLPFSWNWTITPSTFSFINGTTANSQNPKVVFNALGTYDIQLNVSNPNGVDSTIQTNVVNISNGGAIPYSEDFESGAYPSTDFSIVNSDNSTTWQLVSTTGADGNPTQASYMNNHSYNTSGEEDRMVIDLDLTSDTAASMTFDLSYTRRFASFSDTLQIDIYTKCTRDYLGTVYHKGGLDLATVPGQSIVYSPSAASDWRSDSVDLSPYVGNGIQLEFVNRNGFGNNLYIDNINIFNTPINISNPVIVGVGGNGSIALSADFDRSQGDFCVGQTVSVFDNSIGNIASYAWDFGTDATPQTATGAGPHNTTYSSNGQKTMKLVVTDINGNTDSTTTNVFIDGIPTTNFTLVQLNDSTISLTSGATFANSLLWDFGDGNTSTAPNPQHTYDSTGTFIVTLTVEGDCGTIVNTEDVTTQLVNAENILTVAERISVFPNPNDGRFTLQITGATKDLTLKVVDVQGRVLREWQEQNPTMNYAKKINIDDFAQGVYFLQVQTDEGVDVVRIIKE
ncbi:MAG: S8 family serine peptidase [Saprospiraceae bacterium]